MHKVKSYLKNQASRKQKALLRVLILGSAALIYGSVIWAHHSHANFDMTVYTKLEGRVKEILWINPHIWIFIEVVGDNGKAVQWALESATPIQLAKRGVTRDTVHEGDMVSVRCHRLKDNANGCLLGYLTGRDNVERLWD